MIHIISRDHPHDPAVPDILDGGIHSIHNHCRAGVCPNTFRLRSSVLSTLWRPCQVGVFCKTFFLRTENQDVLDSAVSTITLACFSSSTTAVLVMWPAGRLPNISSISSNASPVVYDVSVCRVQHFSGLTNVWKLEPKVDTSNDSQAEEDKVVLPANGR